MSDFTVYFLKYIKIMHYLFGIILGLSRLGQARGPSAAARTG